MPKFCPTCGNSSEGTRFFGNFCENCAKEKFFSRLPKSVEITVCKRCGRIKAGGSFVPPNGHSIELAIKPQMGKHTAHLIDYDNDSAKLDVTDDTEYGKLSVELTVEITQRKALCEMCYKKACDYYEAVIQLRGNNYKIARFIEHITRFFDVNNEFITRIERTDDGPDLYLSNKRLAQAYISKNRLHSTNSYTLAGVRNGKRIFKNTYAIRYE
jgi:NMD protein affecting ribosome stability and mRNA decay